MLVSSQTGRAHLLLISSTPGFAGGAIGVVTLEDVIEVCFGSLFEFRMAVDVMAYTGNHIRRDRR